MINNRSTLTITFLVLITLWVGCKSTEAPVTVVEGDPKAASADTTIQAEDEASLPEFMQLTVGELHPIKSMDPLFASNTSTKRFIQQLYEGLVRYNESGEVVPAIASDWKVSDDSLTYRFTLRNNVYYHDNDVFASGRGQRVISDDFRFVFKRMARLNVPPTAAKLFMAIEGFEPYYREQHQLFDPDDRRLNDISGIKTPNDTTLIFELQKTDPHFLQKLATPYAVVYPREAVVNTPDDIMISEPVGSGPFQFSQRQNDSTYILASFEEYWQNRNTEASVPRLNRLNFEHRTPETLYEEFTEGEIDLIPEIGPSSAQQLIDSTGQLTASAKKQNLQLHRGGSLTYRILYNRYSNQSRSLIHKKLDQINMEEIASAIHPSVMKVSYKRTLKLPDASPELASPVEIPYSDDPYIQRTVKELKAAFQQQAIDFRMNDLRVPVKNTGLIADQQIDLYPFKTDTLDAMTLVRFSVQHVGLSKDRLTRFTLNRYPWWIDLRTVALKKTETSS